MKVKFEMIPNHTVRRRPPEKVGLAGQRRSRKKFLPATKELVSHARRYQKTLWATADKLRANMDAAEYKHVVLGLIFVKYISDTFQTRSNARDLVCKLYAYILGRLRLPDAEALIEEAAV